MKPLPSRDRQEAVAGATGITSRKTQASAHFAEIGSYFVAGDWLHLAGFQIVLPTIERFAPQA
jgi:hypothetical protein